MPNIFSKIKLSVLLLIVVIVVAALLRFVQWLTPVSVPSLLTQAENLVQLTSIDQIQNYTQTAVVAPTTTFNSVLQVIGVYPTSTLDLPKDTVSLVYVRDGYRFVDISFRPKTPIEQALNPYQHLTQEKIALGKNKTATLINIRKYSTCKKPSDEVIGICQISRALVFERENQTIFLFADGNHPSNGELIEMARSIL